MVLLEVNPRRSGNILNYVFLQTYGIDFESDSLLCQWDYNLNINADVQGPYAASLEFPKKSGVVKDIVQFKLPNGSKQKWNYLVGIGEKVEKARDNSHHAATVLLTNPCFDKLR